MVGGWQVQLVSNLVDLPPDGEWTDKPGTGQPETDVPRRQPIARLVWRGQIDDRHQHGSCVSGLPAGAGRALSPRPSCSL